MAKLPSTRIFSKTFNFLERTKDALHPLYVIAFLVYLAIMATTFLWNRVTENAWLTTPLFNPITGLLLGGIAFFLGIFLSLSRKPISHFTRFGKIKSITYGYVEYSPFFWIRQGNCHEGIGIEVLKNVFDGKIELNCCNYEYGDNGNNWYNVFDDLCKDKRFDVIITPLFETRSRLFSHPVLYCSPLFYSNIGIYVDEKKLTTEDKDFCFDSAIEFLKQKIEKNSWSPEFLKGEISEALVRKHNLYNRKRRTHARSSEPAQDVDFVKILKNLSSPDQLTGEFTFMEVFKAKTILKSDRTIVVRNILLENELLYPVSFVLRKEDTVLRNLINIRLGEMRNTRAKDSTRLKTWPEHSCLLKKLSEDETISELECLIKLQAVVGGLDEAEFKSVFVQKYDLNNLTK